MHKLNLAFLLLLLAVAAQPANADGILLTWSPRDITGITEQSFNEAKKAKVEDVLSKNLKITSWSDTYLVALGANANKTDKNLLSGLISQLTDNTKVSLKDTNKLIIWERITSGEILFEGKGFQVDDDLFTPAGRANWMLRTMTSKNFGHVKPNSSAEELKTLQEKWTRWMKGEQVEEFKNPYATSIKGLSEIRSREALEALIVSLKSSDKDRLTYIHTYLRTITGIADKNDYDWWKKWWEANMNSLKWNPEQGLFEVAAANKP